MYCIMNIHCVSCGCGLGLSNAHNCSFFYNNIKLDIMAVNHIISYDPGGVRQGSELFQNNIMTNHYTFP